MPPRKSTKTTTLGTTATKIGEPVPKGTVDNNTASPGIPSQSDIDARQALGALRKQVDVLRRQVADVAQAVKGGARQAARQTEATVKLYPVSTLVTVAAVAGAVAFAVAGLRAAPPRSRSDRALDEMRDLYDRIRGRLL
ncbi:hypothetical protein AB4Z52_25795 [Rhizobium sp. 2YAF20]|uniref:hypothetical protein n=1 Tax=Rhizobium sp. 2YAF20 TaxID=3233027 RepID=UPI003F9A94C9